MVPRNAPWLSDFKNELASFPVGVHDDQVDALGLVGQLLDLISSGREPVENRPVPKQISYEVQPDGSVKTNVSANDLIRLSAKKRTGNR